MCKKAVPDGWKSSPVPVGQSPTGTGGSPVLPIGFRSGYEMSGLGRTCRTRLSLGLLLPALLGTLSGAWAQGVLTPPSEAYEKPAASYSLTTNVNVGIPPLATSGAPAPGPFQSGLWDFHPHLLYRFIYGDGIPAGPTNHFKTIIQEISPGLLLNVGDHWTLDYTPTVRLYSSKQFPNSTDELAVLSGHTTYQDWGFGLSQTYAAGSSPLVETESLADQVNYLTTLQASRQLGSQLSAQLSLSQSLQSTSVGNIDQEVEQWTLNPALNYQVSSQFGIGLQGSFGYDAISPGSDMTFEQAQGTMSWQPGEKLTLNASAGLEVRQLLGTQIINPIYNGAITYRPWKETAASLGASRTVSPSFYQDDVLVSSTISATLRQEFLQHYNVEVSGGYTTSPFVGFATVEAFNQGNQIYPAPPLVMTTVQQNRTDISRFLRVSLGSTFLQRGTVSVFYSYNDTTSGLAAFSLTSTQVGIELGWRY
jgi:hypothetical protein